MAFATFSTCSGLHRAVMAPPPPEPESLAPRAPALVAAWIRVSSFDGLKSCVCLLKTTLLRTLQLLWGFLHETGYIYDFQGGEVSFFIIENMD